MPDILHRIDIAAAPARVYAALTTAEGIRHWWTRDADLDARVGGIGTFRFYDGRGVTRIRIDELVPPHRVRWTVLDSNAPGGWTRTTLAFGVHGDGAGAVLSFAHRGFAEENDGVAVVSTGWAYYLVSLKRHLEIGEGAPQQDKDFLRVLG